MTKIILRRGFYCLLICAAIIITIVFTAGASDSSTPADFPINENGQTYGGAMDRGDGFLIHPNLVAAVGIDGTEGYILKSDMDSHGPLGKPNNPEEALEYMDKLLELSYEQYAKGEDHTWYIPLYDSDGKTIIGKYGSGDPVQNIRNLGGKNAGKEFTASMDVQLGEEAAIYTATVKVISPQKANVTIQFPFKQYPENLYGVRFTSVSDSQYRFNTTYCNYNPNPLLGSTVVPAGLLFVDVEYSDLSEEDNLVTWTMKVSEDSGFNFDMLGEEYELSCQFENGTADVFAANVEFSDIAGHWAEETINKWKDQGIVSGYPDGTFKPDNPVTRAEFAKILTVAFDLQQPGELNYNDIDASAWYYPYLEFAARYMPLYPLSMLFESNIPYNENWDPAKQDGAGFLPENHTIRMHVAEALVEIKKDRDNLDIKLPLIQDVRDTLYETFKDNDWFNLLSIHGEVPKNVSRMFNYAWLANELDIMKGDDEGYFRPYDYITRAELLTTIDRMLA